MIENYPLGTAKALLGRFLVFFFEDLCGNNVMCCRIKEMGGFLYFITVFGLHKVHKGYNQMLVNLRFIGSALIGEF